MFVSFNPFDVKIRQVVQQDIDSFVSWTEEIQMKLNASKTTVLHLGNSNPRINYKIKDKPIKSVDYQEDLGVIFSTNLSFSLHIKTTTASCFRVIGIIRRIFGNISEKQFKILYKTMIRPKLDYCSSIYSPSSNEDIEQLERVQKKMTKLVRGFSDKQYQERCLALKISSLKTRRIRGDLIEMFKIMTGIYNVNHEDYFI